MREFVKWRYLSVVWAVKNLKPALHMIIPFGLLLLYTFLRDAEEPIPEITIANHYGKVFDIYGAESGDFPYKMTVLLDDGRDVEVYSRNIRELTKTRRICVLEIDTQTRVDPIIFRHDPTCEADS